MQTAAPGYAGTIRESDQDEHNIARTATAVVLYAPRKVRRGFTRAWSWTMAHKTDIGTLLLNLVIICVSLLVAAGSAYLTYAIMAALYTVSPVIFYGILIYYALCVVGGLAFWAWVSHAAKAEEAA